MSVPEAPVHLKAAGRRLWDSVTDAHLLEAHHLAILATACEAQDRVTEAREAVERDGPYLPGRWGTRSHPALAVERDNRVLLLRALRELGLDFATEDET
jgi:P27 family predicted phage terminase small subunit